jgi:hypothetical protein
MSFGAAFDCRSGTFILIFITLFKRRRPVAVLPSSYAIDTVASRRAYRSVSTGIMSTGNEKDA